LAVVVIGDGSQRTSAVSGCHAEIATNQRRVAPRSSKSLVMTVAGRPAARAACRCRRLAQPLFPQNLLYYDIAEPHHLVKFVGSFGYLAPQVTVEMTKVYIASNQRDDAQEQWTSCTGSGDAAALLRISLLYLVIPRVVGPGDSS
jgi:hypothetical protein